MKALSQLQHAVAAQLVTGPYHAQQVCAANIYLQCKQHMAAAIVAVELPVRLLVPACHC
jgi:hypothetical protein